MIPKELDLTFTLRRVASTCVLAVAATALTLPLAAPARAATAERTWTVTYVAADDSYELFSTEPAGTPQKVDGSATASISHLAASADGSRITYLRETYLPATADVKQEIVVRDTSSRQVRVLDTRLYSSGVYPDLPALSPDGTKAVWESYDDSTGVVSVRKSIVGSGTATTLDSANHTPYAFLTNDTVLVQTDAGDPFTESFSGGATHAVPGLPAEAINVTVSPDGSTLAWALLTSMTAPYASTLQVATLTVNPDGTASVGTATNLDSTLYNRQPAFSRDGATLYYLKTSGAGGAAGDVWSVPVAGGSATQYATTTDDIDVALTTSPSADTTAPAAATTTPGTLSGTSATVRWTLPADADLSGVLLTRKLGSTTQKLEVYVPAPVTSYVDTGLTLGATYTYEITAIDRSANRATVATRHLMALQAAATFADPTSGTSAKAAFPVSFGPSSSGRFTVDYLLGGTTTWHRWVTDTAGRTRTFGSAATTGVAATTSAPGTSYGFRVQVKDSYGNATALVASAHAVVPFDQTKATLSGGTNVSSTAAFLGSYRRLSKTTDYAKVTLVGSRLQVVGWKCTTCGVFTIYDGSSLVGTIDTRASSTVSRTVLFTRTYSSVGTHTFTIRPKATSGRPYVLLDGFATRR